MMKYTYSTNCMGPYGLWWYEENNIPFTTSIANNRFTNFKDVEQKHYEPWYGGRIDVYSGEHYPDEIGLPIMTAESYGRFSEWLDKYSSSELKSFDELRELFENKEQFKLVIHNEIKDIKMIENNKLRSIYPGFECVFEKLKDKQVSSEFWKKKENPLEKLMNKQEKKKNL